MAALIVSLLLLVKFTLPVRSDEPLDLLVHTNTGTIKGMVVSSYTEKDVIAFYGIPYAEPPVGENRFKPPVPIKPWEGTFDATKSPVPCYQQYSKESFREGKILNSYVRRPWSEDCLTLNVWRPKVLTPDPPIFMTIHEGGFLTGAAGFPYYKPLTFATEADMIVVTMNYRLGAFGFLSLGTSEFPGNLGLMDQQIAVRWIDENIILFGGKRGAMFLFGYEAGAASVGYHIILPENAGLFKTGILMAGSPTCSWAWQTKETSLKLAKALSRNLRCESSNSTEEIECLQRAHPEDIVDASLGTMSMDSFKPNIDGYYLKETPTESMRGGRFNNNTVITNSQTQDGVLKFFTLNENRMSDPEYELTIKAFKETLEISSLARNPTETEIISEWYFKNKYPTNGTKIREAAIDAYSDGLFWCCANEFANFATRKGVLTYRVINAVPDLRLPSWLAHHHLAYQPSFSGETLNPALNYSVNDKRSTLTLLYRSGDYMRRKAKDFQEVVPLYNELEKPYLLWNYKNEFKKKFREDECVLWDEILPKLRSSSQAKDKCL